MFNVDCFIVASYIPNTDLNNGCQTRTNGCPSPPTASRLVTSNIPLLGGGVGDPISPASNAAASSAASTASAQARAAAGLNWQQQQPQ